MSYGIRRQFYTSKLWKNVKKEVWLNQSCLCAICHKPVYVDGISEYIPKGNRRTGIVHHIKHLTDSNINDDDISIKINNLIGVCKDCHEKEHHKDQVVRQGYTFDDEGNLVSS